VSSPTIDPVLREYAAWTGDVERRVIFPLKYLLLVLVALHWQWQQDWRDPSPAAFGVFVVTLFVTLGAHYFLLRDRLTPRQIRPFAHTLFFLDALAVSAVALLELWEPPATQLAGGSYYVLYALLVLRGLALFRTATENTVGFLAASLLFLFVASIDVKRAALLDIPHRLQDLALLWGVMLLGQAFVTLINARKEEQLRFRERLAHSASLSGLGALSAGVAHEINNPIGIIKAYCDFLVKSMKPTDPIREDVETIKREAERCEGIVRQMLSFANPQLQGLAPVPLEPLCSEIIALVFHESQASGIECSLQSTGELPPVAGDAIQLRQAIMNVLMNARQILTEHPPAEPRVGVILSRGVGPRAPVRVEVLDNGPGLGDTPPEKFFEPFLTKRAGGTGLGLAITRRILEAHGGRIELLPRAEGGARVLIELPIEGENLP
jgi:signal transduction histidine kinase